jgi:hypothetical protein
MPIYEDLCAIPWPSEFVVEYTDGTREHLLRGNGVHITPPADDPEGIGALCADLPKKHVRNQQHSRDVHFSELRAITSVDGRMLWSRTGNV